MALSALLEFIPQGAGIALVEPDSGWTMSYDALHETVDALSAQLFAAGARRGTGVALVLEPGAEIIPTFLAVTRLGAIALPLNPQLQAEEMARTFSDLQMSLLVVDRSGNAAARRAAAGDHIPVTALSRGARPRLDNITDAESASVFAESEDVALLLHTSGTTSRPKAVALRQRHLVTSAQSIAAGYGLTEADVSYCLMPLFHIHGLVASVLSTLTVGGTVVIPQRLRVNSFWEQLSRHNVTWFSAVPTILARLQESENPGKSSLRFARSCSSALSPTLWSQLEQHFGVPLVEAYGMTEATHQMATNPLPPAARRAGSVGTAVGTDLAIVNDAWEQLEAGQTGEVVVRGPAVIDAYLGNPQANAESFRDGWFRTGDLGAMSPDGYLSLRGRVKELINRGGEKISPREIDDALLTHPLVREAVAFGIPDAKYGEIVHAAVVLDADTDAQALRDHCAEQLAPFKVPRRIHVLPEIPKSATGKIQRRLLTERFGP